MPSKVPLSICLCVLDHCSTKSCDSAHQPCHGTRKEMIMPAYEYKCEKCQVIFMEIQTFSKHDRHEKVKCPKCGSQRVRQLISAVNVQTSKKS